MRQPSDEGGGWQCGVGFAAEVETVSSTKGMGVRFPEDIAKGQVGDENLTEQKSLTRQQDCLFWYSLCSKHKNTPTHTQEREYKKVDCGVPVKVSSLLL